MPLLHPSCIRAHIFVAGSVQGVFFRDSACKKAKELGITGWVKNTPDGRVETIFEGEKESVEKMVDWVRIGPAFARVDKLDVLWEDCKGEFRNFEIIR